MPKDFEKLPCWVIDLLPCQVPAERASEFFAVEQHLLSRPSIDKQFQRFSSILLKLSCYYDLHVVLPRADKTIICPAPNELVRLVMGCVTEELGEKGLLVYVKSEGNVESKGATILLDTDSINMAVFGPSDGLLAILRQLAGAEGLFVWAPPQG